VVNHDLEKWCKEKLFFEKVIYLPNFTIFNGNEVKKTTLEGIEGKRIVCLANLRHPKNHKLLLEVAIKLRKTNPEWTFHFIGKDLHDEYSNELKSIIKANRLEESVFIYDVREDIDHILQQASIGVLASSSEGLPVAVLEYGMHSMAVVATNVGEIPQVVEDGLSGLIVPSDAVALFYDALMRYINSPVLINKFGIALKDKINASHTEAAVIANYTNWIQNELTC
jgi:glycosyltransferase involved in cell wall biosynthesis